MGRLNWSKAAAERRIRDRGYEPLAREDRTLPGGRLLPQELNSDGAAKPKTTHELAAEGRKRKERITTIQKRKARKQAAAIRKAVDAARKVEDEKQRKEAAERRSAKRREDFVVKLERMTPAERVADEARIARTQDVRMRGVVVEQRSLGMPSRKVAKGRKP